MTLQIEIEKTDDFYNTYEDWCNEHKFPTILRSNVEDEVFVCYNDSTPIYSIFLWNTGSTMCLVGWPASNPFVPMAFKKGGLDYLLKGMCVYLKKRGYKLAWTVSGTERVMKSLKKAGFTLADQNINQYIKQL